MKHPEDIQEGLSINQEKEKTKRPDLSYIFRYLPEQALTDLKNSGIWKKAAFVGGIVILTTMLNMNFGGTGQVDAHCDGKGYPPCTPVTKSTETSALTVTATATNTATATATATATNTASPTPTVNFLRTQIADTKETIRDLAGLGEAIDALRKPTAPPAPQYPYPPYPPYLPNYPYPPNYPPPQPAPTAVAQATSQPPVDSVNEGIKVAKAIETIVQGRIDGKLTATADARTPTPYPTKGPIRVELAPTPIDVRVIENRRDWPWWGVALATLAGVGIIAALVGRQRIITYIHEHTAPHA